MMENFLVSAQTGDGFNPVIVIAIGAAALVALVFLLHSSKRGK